MYFWRNYFENMKHNIYIKAAVLVVTGLFLMSACKSVKAPKPVYPLPSADQVAWHKTENYAFVHFGLNTFNDLEWGFGNTSPETFNPTNLDCEQWVRTFKAAGLKGVILTTKHHDGFCLWPTKTTDYNISHSPYKNGKGDMVRELSDACHKYGLKFGAYVSPWDRHNANYAKPEYVETYHNQIQELITNYGPLFEFWFDGANGGNGWYGGANEKRSIDPNSYYQYERARDSIKAHHPSAMIFGGTVPDIRWIGNEEGWSGDTQWSFYSYAKEKISDQSQWGMEDADQWMGGECDVSMRPGWFYHPREDHQIKSLAHLVDLYYLSVGHNANFILNFPVARDGRITKADSLRAMEWHETLVNDFKTDLLKGIVPFADNIRGKAFAPDKANDSNWDSYWATADGVTKASITFPFKQPQEVNRVLIQEYIPLGQRVRSFIIETESSGIWKPVEAVDSTTTVGYKRIVRFRTVKADKLRIRFTDARGPLCINNIQAFLAPALITEPILSRSYDSKVSITSGNVDAQIHYTTDGSTPTLQSPVYSGPFEFARKGIIKALAADKLTGKTSAVSETDLDIPSNYYTLTPDSKEAQNLFDGDGYSVYNLPAEKQEITVCLNKSYTLTGFRYVPNQQRDAVDHISSYELYVNDQKVAEGEFSNIVNNPIEQVVHFTPVKGDEIRFVAKRATGEKGEASIGEFSVITE